jgi:hypothetical protein
MVLYKAVFLLLKIEMTDQLIRGPVTVNKKVQLDATVCRHLFTAKSLYMFQVSQHPSSGALITVTATSGIGHNTGTATSFQRGPVTLMQYFIKIRWPGSDWLRAGRSGNRVQVEARFSAPVQTDPGAHPASCTMGTGAFPGVKNSRGVTLPSLPSSAVVKKG